MLASRSTKSFYDKAIHTSIPDDAVEITTEFHQELLIGDSADMCIAWNDEGYPFLAERPVVYESATQLSAKIDARIADIYATWTRFEAEYLFREAAAVKFRDAGYTGDAGIWIEAFADAAGLGLQTACDLILSQSANLRAAQEALGALRMRKYEIAPLTGAAAAAKYDEICAAITLVASQIS